MFALGIAIFAAGIVISLALHEAGHMWSARAFGMKVTRYFIGFGPTLFAFRRRDTEYGVKAIPLGAFVKIVGMTPQDDDVPPGEEHRAMWRYPVWKRTIVLAAGSMTHFAFALLLMWIIFAFVPLPDFDKRQTEPVRVDTVSACTAPRDVDLATHTLQTCTEGTDPDSAAKIVGLRPGDVVTAIDGVNLVGWDALTERIRESGGETVTLSYERDGVPMTATFVMPEAERIKQSVATDPTMTLEKLTANDLETVGVLGITAVTPTTVAGPAAAFTLTGERSVDVIVATFDALKKFPEKVPKLWEALSGGERDPETPVSVVGASRIGGELFEEGEVAGFLGLLATLNFFVGIFNLIPLLPLDGGHIAIAWFEKARSWLYARLGRADPGRVDYMKLMPITYVVILIFGGFTLLTVAADIINPIRLFR